MSNKYVTLPDLVLQPENNLCFVNATCEDIAHLNETLANLDFYILALGICCFLIGILSYWVYLILRERRRK